MKRVQKISAAITAMLLALAASILLTMPAQAADSAPITKYHVNVELDETGTAHVTIDMVMDFAIVKGRGPYLTFATHMDSGSNPKEQFNFDYSNFHVSSSTGANTNVEEHTGDNTITLKIGDAKIFNHTPEQYTISYDLFGIVATNHPESGLDEFSWNAIGTQWESDFQDIQVTIAGPAAITRAACFYSHNMTTPCPTTRSAGTSTYTLASLPKKTGMQVVAGFPAGTFPGVAQKIVHKQSWTDAFQLNPATGAATTLGLVTALGLLWRIYRRYARDEIYLGITPGLVPTPEQESTIRRGRGKVRFAVQFHPPRGVTPGEIGMLLNGDIDNGDIAATIVDLAVRGFLTIESHKRKAFTLRLADPPADGQLATYEKEMLAEIFGSDTVRHSKELRAEKYIKVLSSTKLALSIAVWHKQWFIKGLPASGKGLPTCSGIFFIILSFFMVLVAGSSGWGLVGLPLAFFGCGLMWLAYKFNPRTALGSAILSQAKGFERYLRTAEKETLQLEETQDIFSTYLPYAMVFGIADRWTKLFVRLNKEGLYHADTSWYIGSDLTHGFAFARAISSFPGSVSSTLSAATRSSSGSSGFSGGGGFGGGGGGSW